MVLVLWFMLWVEWENAKAPHRPKAKEEIRRRVARRVARAKQTRPREIT